MRRRDSVLDLMKGIAVVVMVSVHPVVFNCDFDTLPFSSFFWAWDALAIPLFFYCFGFGLGLRPRSVWYCLRSGSSLFYAGVFLGVVCLLGSGVFSSGVLFVFSVYAFLLPVFHALLCRVGFLFGSVLLVVCFMVLGVLIDGDFSSFVVSIAPFVLGYSSSRFALDFRRCVVLAAVVFLPCFLLLGFSSYALASSFSVLALPFVHRGLFGFRSELLEMFGRSTLPIYIFHHFALFGFAAIFNGGRVASYASVFRFDAGVSVAFLIALCLICFSVSFAVLSVRYVQEA